MPDSEAPGDSRLDEPVDTDRLDVGARIEEPLAPRASREPEESPAPDDLADPWYAEPVEPGPPVYRFDAFDTDTWHFKPPPTPWYRTRQAVVGIALVGLAVVALIVALVLLTIHGRSEDQPSPAPATSTTPTTEAATSSSASASLPPPPPPPLPPPPPPPPTGSAPTYYPREAPRPTKKPEINVTRAPISVAPQPRGRG